jgi:NAD(P)-dependent dehydrogenase (short-subunit alcohol dehydrogenase family)
MTDSPSLAEKTIWVTGGAGYLGAPITVALDAAARQVVCFDLAGKAEALVRDRGLARTIPLHADVNAAAGLPLLVESTIARHGVPDGLVHLAFASSAGRTLEQLSIAEFERTLTLSLPPAFELCRLLAEKMRSRGGGSIVLFSSMYGMVAPDPRIYAPPMTPNPIDYGVSKAAVLQLARYLAVHFGPAGIRCNCITPGPFPNPGLQEREPAFVQRLADKTALRRFGRNHEIVGPTLFLLSDSASFVTGQSLVVDGGWTAW